MFLSIKVDKTVLIICYSTHIVLDSTSHEKHEEPEIPKLSVPRSIVPSMNPNDEEKFDAADGMLYTEAEPGQKWRFIPDEVFTPIKNEANGNTVYKMNKGSSETHDEASNNSGLKNNI